MDERTERVAPNPPEGVLYPEGRPDEPTTSGVGQREKRPRVLGCLFEEWAVGGVTADHSVEADDVGRLKLRCDSHKVSLPPPDLSGTSLPLSLRPAYGHRGR